MPWPLPVKASEPNNSTLMCWVAGRLRDDANSRAAFIGPTVCELEGPMPMENRLKTLIVIWISIVNNCYCQKAIL